MYPFYTRIAVILFLAITMASTQATSQTCTPQGDQTTSGTSNVWIAYLYQGINFDTYKGYVNRGSASNPAIDESFGGENVNFATNGCDIVTQEFSVRFKLTKTFADANYRFTAGGDDGYRLSIDGGNTWIINNWGEHGYTSSTYDVHLNGSVNLVLEYYERFGANRVTFNVETICVGDGDPTAYGTSNSWIGYLYQGQNFNMYRGYITRGSGSGMQFDENFGSSSGTFNTSNCSITTNDFSARFRTRATLSGSYQFTVGGDDGYRLSLDGGNTWIINRWQGQSYYVSNQTVNGLNGTYNIVLEYYENTGDNRLSFNMTQLTVLPVNLISFTATPNDANKTVLNWSAADAINFNHFMVQKSNDGLQFRDIAKVATQATNSVQNYTYTDVQPGGGKAWYRLAMVDKDGSVRYSTLVAVSIPLTGGFRIYPTVVESNQVFVECATKLNRAQVEWVDMNGRVLQSEKRSFTTGRQVLSVPPTASKTAGTYIVRITGDQGVQTRQHLIIR
ncbi:PA14 domain-containing protein [Paraflavitalea pollutisoli]|uniref:PA14 domain-containing protein n=1 Tax=Paraflavitalea pollutisoli TaxID=3034143 RepID=UPI0023ED7360|nr:PA14 domain-containing protein [Paraflavitalea sp. H1-2-19X]